MRDIKFRVWDIIHKRFLENFIVYQYGNIAYNDIWIPNKEVELMQFTGLLDKNGKEIYDGDIISYVYGSGIPSTSTVGWGGDVVGYIPFCDEGWSSRVDISTIEVIGNIYENS